LFGGGHHGGARAHARPLSPAYLKRYIPFTEIAIL
jgi:hypothetical protein